LTNEKEVWKKVFDPLFNSINPLRRLPPKPFPLENNRVRQTSRYRSSGKCAARILFWETLCLMKMSKIVTTSETLDTFELITLRRACLKKLRLITK
jgi:hypothetical protein